MISCTNQLSVMQEAKMIIMHHTVVISDDSCNDLMNETVACSAGNQYYLMYQTVACADGSFSCLMSRTVACSACCCHDITVCTKQLSVLLIAAFK
jgi:hypothetical protein